MRVEVDADVETPISAFLKLRQGHTHAFLLESVEGGERTGRWTFLGAGPRDRFEWNLSDGGDPLDWVAKKLAAHRAVDVEGVPRFAGGLVGFLAYDAVKVFEPRVPISRPDALGFPSALWMDFHTVLAFDNLRHTLHVIAQVLCNEGDDPRALHADALRRISAVLKVLRRPLSDPRPRAGPAVKLVARTSRKAFEAAVEKARDFIRAGDCQQIVLSQRFEAQTGLPPFELYRALRRVNPSPYLFFVQAGRHALIGSSPETLVRLEGREITLRPIAGTRKRGKTAEQDAALEAELRADPKENAEHVMLVDLGRNDVGRVAQIGSVKVEVFKAVERYSHVMHLASQVRGTLAPGRDALDVLRATFPAGTVTGAPKIRAMQIIDALESARRGPYAGCVGYFDRHGNMEMCIAIRTLLQHGKRLSVQAGAGIVFDSVPSAEFEETLNKARALFSALAQAQAGPRR